MSQKFLNRDERCQLPRGDLSFQRDSKEVLGLIAELTLAALTPVSAMPQLATLKKRQQISEGAATIQTFSESQDACIKQICPAKASSH